MVSVNQDYQTKVKNLYNQSKIIFTMPEFNNIEFTDFGLNNIENEGLNLIIYINTDRYCAKEMVLLPHQACPEHRHPDLAHAKGKQETFRCRWGKVYLYVEGDSNTLSTSLPKGKNQQYYTVRKEIILMPGEQYTINPNIKHWFKAGDEGAVISEFSSTSYDQFDIFTNPNINRLAQDQITMK